MSSPSKAIRSKDLDFKVVEKASELVFEKLRADESYPDLADQFTRRIDQPGSHRYFMNYKHLFGSMVEHVSYIPFPKKIKDCINRVETSTFMGILPEIDRAWITVDNVLYVWSFKRPEEYDVYDGLSEVIVSVSLSTPKPGIFLESIKYVLVVATAVEVVLLALAFDDSGESMKLIPTSYAVSSDNTTMIKVAGTQSGRIFMAGEDGNLYELDYTSGSDTWASLLGFKETNRHKCQKINHHQWNWRLVSLLPSFIRSLTGGEDPLIEICVDNVRHILYTITTKGYLSVFSLGIDLQSTNNCVYQFSVFDAIKKYVSARIYLESSLQVDGLKDLAHVSIVGLHVIPVTESKKVHAVAILSTGVRVYLRLLSYSSTSSNGYSANISSTRIPTSIDVAFIRSPPPPNAINCSQPRVPLESGMESGCLPSYLPMQLLNVKCAYYCQGMFLTSLSSANTIVNHNSNIEDESSDKLVAIYEDLMSHDFTPDTLLTGQTPNLREAISMVTSSDGSDIIQGKIYDIKEKDVSSISPVTAKVQTLLTLSATPVSSQVLYTEEELQTHQNGTLCSDSMKSPLPSSVLPNSLNAQGKGKSWGLGKNTSDLAIIRNEFVTSHVPILNRNQHRQFLCLTNKGVHAFTKLTPADLLVRLLSTATKSSLSLSSSSSKSAVASMGFVGENYPDEIRIFFERYGAVQSSVMCIALACGLPSAAGNYVDKALSAWSSCTNGEVNINLANRAILAMQRLTQGPNLRAPNVAASSMNVGASDPRLAVRGSVSYDYATSPVLDALFFITSRIVRPLWLRAIVKDNGLAEYVDPTSIFWMKESLTRLHVYFEEYHPLVIRGDPIVNITANDQTSSSSMRSHIGGNSSVMDSLFAMSQNISHEKQLSQYARNLEDATLNAVYRLNARTIQALDLILLLYELDRKRNIPIPWSILTKYTLKSWVVSSNVHELIKRVIREVLTYFTSPGNALTKQPTLPIVDCSSIMQEFFANVSSKCYYYFSQGDRCAYEAVMEEEKIKQFLQHHVSNYSVPSTIQSEQKLISRIPSHELRQQLHKLMKNCVDLWILAVRDWKAIDYVMPIAQGNLRAPNSRTSLTDYNSELSRICKSLRELGGYCRGGIVDICMLAARNFHYSDSELNTKNSTLYSRSTSSRGGSMPDLNEWEHEIYHGRPSISEDVLAKAKKECYNCLVNQFLEIIQTNKFASNETQQDSSSEFEPSLQDMINRSMTLCQNDTSFHELLFDTFLRESPKVLIQMKPTIFLEEYLKVADPLLLYRHYEYNGEFTKAAILMASLAQTDKPLNVATRVEYLRSAVDSASRASSIVARTTQSVLVLDTRGISPELYQDMLDVAVIQLSIHERFQSLSTIYAPHNHPMIGKVQSELIEISTLFNEVTQKYCFWDISLLLMQTARHQDNEIIARLWRSVMYRRHRATFSVAHSCVAYITRCGSTAVEPASLSMFLSLGVTSLYETHCKVQDLALLVVPIRASSDAGEAFLHYKRLPDYIDTDEVRSKQTSASVTFEMHSSWRMELFENIIQTACKVLGDNEISSPQRYFPITLILEELEDISSTLFVAGSPLPRGCILSDCMVKIPVASHLIVEAYLSLLDHWIGKSTEKLLSVVSTATYVLRNWIEKAIENRSSGSFRQLILDINSGQMLQWQDKIRRQINVLTSKVTIAYSVNRVAEERALVEEVSRDSEAISQFITNITFQ